MRAMQQMTSTELYFRLLRYVKPYWQQSKNETCATEDEIETG